VTDQEVAKLAAEFGPTKCIFNQASKRGIAFITFQDLRHAQDAVASLDNREIHGRAMHASFAFSMSDNSRNDPVPACATITCRSEKEDAKMNEQDIASAFSRYGDIRQVIMGEKPSIVIVKYFDMRAAKKAVEETGSIIIRGGRIFVEFNQRADSETIESPRRSYRPNDSHDSRPSERPVFQPPPYRPPPLPIQGYPPPAMYLSAYGPPAPYGPPLPSAQYQHFMQYPAPMISQPFQYQTPMISQFPYQGQALASPLTQYGQATAFASQPSAPSAVPPPALQQQQNPTAGLLAGIANLQKLISSRGQ
jgi:RNA recognition motif-containing protein